MAEPRVTVIIPTYNYGHFILKAVQSVLEQTFQDFVLHVVDDGSTDNTRDILGPLIQSGRIQYHFQENAGPARAKNQIAFKTRGPFLAFLDGDDTWMPQKLEECVAYLEGHPEFAMVYHDFEVVNQAGDHLYTCFSDKKMNAEGWILEPLLKECFIVPSVAMLRTDVFHKSSGFRENLRYGEDYALWLDIAAAHQVGRIVIPLARYLRHGNNMTRNRRNRARDSVILAREWYRRLPGKVSVETLKWYRRHLSQLIFEEGFFEFSEDQYTLARQHFAESLKYRWYHALSLGYYLATYLSPGMIAAIRRFKRKAGLRLNLD